MNNFNIQLQTIKSQIDNMKLQITNIEMQYNNINASFQGEQLMNIGIQMLNTGLNSITLGKNISMSSLDNYYNQLKNTSEQINNIINIYTGSNQQKEPMIKQQNQLMQEQMMNQNDFNIQGGIKSKMMNLTFETGGFYRKLINIICYYGTKINDVLDMFSNKIGKNKNQFIFIFCTKRLDYNDDREVEQVFTNGDHIIAKEK